MANAWGVAWGQSWGASWGAAIRSGVKYLRSTRDKKKEWQAVIRALEEILRPAPKTTKALRRRVKKVKAAVATIEQRIVEAKVYAPQPQSEAIAERLMDRAIVALAKIDAELQEREEEEMLIVLLV